MSKNDIFIKILEKRLYVYQKNFLSDLPSGNYVFGNNHSAAEKTALNLLTQNGG